MFRSGRETELAVRAECSAKDIQCRVVGEMDVVLNEDRPVGGQITIDARVSLRTVLVLDAGD